MYYICLRFKKKKKAMLKCGHIPVEIKYDILFTNASFEDASRTIILAMRMNLNIKALKY